MIILIIQPVGGIKMNIDDILAILKALTLDFVIGTRSRKETVEELHKRIDPAEIYDMPDSVQQKAFITEVFVSLDNLITADFAPSFAEMKYFAECFEGKRSFSREEVRRFPIGSFENQEAPKGNR
jgi:hypothetical protein